MKFKAGLWLLVLLYQINRQESYGFYLHPLDTAKPRLAFNKNLANRLLNKVLEKSENQFFINGQFNTQKNSGLKSQHFLILNSQHPPQIF
jgi:hypothetical protein